MLQCKVCGNIEGNTLVQVREMMFGNGEVFPYFVCNHCRCLQIRDIPVNLTDYYPAGYYSFVPVEEGSGIPGRITGMLTRMRNRYLFFGKGVAGRFINTLIPNHRLGVIAMARLTEGSRVLDVGCGNGFLLYQMREAGFSDLLGVDPYLGEDVTYRNGLILKSEHLDEVSGEFDLIMFHHSFEHMSEPERVLRRVHSLLADRGICLIRVPTASSYAWNHYGPDWVQIDAPRHLFLHSKESMEYLAAKAGMDVERVVYDSGAFQFWGSEQHKKGIPLYSDHSYLRNRSGSMFSQKEIRGFEREARRLNREQLGDTCAFFLRKG